MIWLAQKQAENEEEEIKKDNLPVTSDVLVKIRRRKEHLTELARTMNSNLNMIIGKLTLSEKIKEKLLKPIGFTQNPKLSPGMDLDVLYDGESQGPKDKSASNNLDEFINTLELVMKKEGEKASNAGSDATDLDQIASASESDSPE